MLRPLVVDKHRTSTELRQVHEATFMIHSAHSFATAASWLFSVAQSLLGHGVALVITLVVLAWIRRIFIQRDAVVDPVQRTVLLACTFAILPLVLVQLTGTNHLLRHLCPAVVPLAIAVGLLAFIAGWDKSPALLATSGLALLAQLLMLLAPVYCPNTTAVGTGLVNGRLPWRALARFDQWDWKPLREIAAPLVSKSRGSRTLAPGNFGWATNPVRLGFGRQTEYRCESALAARAWKNRLESNRGVDWRQRSRPHRTQLCRRGCGPDRRRQRAQCRP